jgi:glycosyltransferase involved in cell wall biosynthesis
LEPLVTIIIPTFKRGHLLKYPLEGLKKQTYQNFEVIIIHKPSGDDTEKIVKKYSETFPLLVIKQKSGYVTDAYNLGLRKANGEIIAFLDDDAIPSKYWLEEHVKIYKKDKHIGGISGTTKSAQILKNGKIAELETKDYSSKIKLQFNFPWSSPLTGMNNWLIYMGVDGLIHHDPLFTKPNLKGLFPSLLWMGANMSVRKKAIEGIKVNESLILGFAFEQILSYQIWERGYKLLFNPKASVLHITQTESLGRFFSSPKRAALRDAELVLTFSLLKNQEKEFSWISHILGILTLIAARIIRANKYGLYNSIYRIYGLLYGFVTGSIYIISKKRGQKFPVRTFLSKLL